MITKLTQSFIIIVAYREQKCDDKSKVTDAQGSLQWWIQHFQNLGASTLEGCANLLLEKISAENCIQMKEKLHREDCAHPYHPSSIDPLSKTSKEESSWNCH